MLLSILQLRESTFRFRNLTCKRNISNINKITNVLVANRGEIAVRIINTAKSLGIKSTAIFNPADAKCMFVKLADRAVSIPTETPQGSYLDSNKIIETALKFGCNAVHPGYGFLSQSPEFAQDCLNNKITWIGPSPEAMRSMGIKSFAKDVMKKANVPVLPGYHGEDQTMDRLFSEAGKIGFPVMIKPVRGGGGKGMRVVESPDKFKNSVESSIRESLRSFNDDELLIEKYIQNPRHVEVQIFGDNHGNVVHMYERDCSVQRRHQKIIEEAPAPGISENTRKLLGEAAVAAAKAVNYANAGTVEFILNKDESFYFMEMNTRLQVEHPVSEMITGIDFVKLQFLIAEGKPIPFTQSDIKINGHSFETRICAEDPDNDFLPTSGKIEVLKFPTAASARIDTGFSEGDTISSHYDSMISKLIVWGKARPEALRLLRNSLDQTKIVGIQNNLSILKSVISHPEFIKGNIDTGFIEIYKNDLFSKISVPTELIICVASLMYHDIDEPECYLKNFRLNFDKSFDAKLIFDDKEHDMTIKFNPSKEGWHSRTISYNRISYICHFYIEKDEIHFCCNNISLNVSFYKSPESIVLFTKDKTLKFSRPLPKYFKKSHEIEGKKEIVSPMTGTVVKINVNEGSILKKGDIISIIEAMKMEHVIRAPYDSKVVKLVTHIKQTIHKDQLVCIVEPIAKTIL